MSKVFKGACPNQHEHDLNDDSVIADYGKCWRVRCETCRIIYSVSKTEPPKRVKEEA